MRFAMPFRPLHAVGIRTLTVLALWGLGLGGCVAWGTTTARLPPASDLEVPSAGERRALRLAIDYQAPGGRDLQGTRQVREAALEALAGDRRFRLAERGEDAFVLALQLASERDERVWLTVLCILTATVLPAMVTEELDITAELRSPTGELLGERKLAMRQTSMVELFMLFGMPFAWEGKVRGELFRAVLADLLAWSGELTGGVAPTVAP